MSEPKDETETPLDGSAMATVVLAAFASDPPMDGQDKAETFRAWLDVAEESAWKQDRDAVVAVIRFVRQFA